MSVPSSVAELFDRWKVTRDTAALAEQQIERAGASGAPGAELVLIAALDANVEIEEQIVWTPGGVAEKLAIALHHARAEACGGSLDKNWQLVASAYSALVPDEPRPALLPTAMLPPCIAIATECAPALT